MVLVRSISVLVHLFDPLSLPLESLIGVLPPTEEHALLYVERVPHVRAGHLALAALYDLFDGNYRLVRELREEVAEGEIGVTHLEDLPQQVISRR